MRHAYYKSTVAEFLADTPDAILGRLAKINEFDLELNQRDAWLKEIEILKNALQGLFLSHFSIHPLAHLLSKFLT